MRNILFVMRYKSESYFCILLLLNCFPACQTPQYLRQIMANPHKQSHYLFLSTSYFLFTHFSQDLPGFPQQPGRDDQRNCSSPYPLLRSSPHHLHPAGNRTHQSSPPSALFSHSSEYIRCLFEAASEVQPAQCSFHIFLRFSEVSHFGTDHFSFRKRCPSFHDNSF